MKGIFGAMLIALGIFVSIMGGFILNAETVTVCETEWEYVTDVDAAFQGDRSDIDVEYSPGSNVTGWSYLDEYNEGWISGVGYTEARRVNEYAAYSGANAQAEYSVSLSADDVDGSTGSKSFSFTFSPSGPTGSYAMPEGWGLSNSLAMTEFSYGGYAVQGAFAAPLDAIVRNIPGLSESASAELQISSPLSGYPCFAVVESKVSRGEFQHGGLYYTGALASQTATAHATAATYLSAENAVMLGGARYPAADVLVVWGQAQWEGSGTHSDSMSMRVVTQTPQGRVYVDPAFGVVPAPGTYTTYDVVYTETPGSSSGSLSVSLSRPSGMSLATASGSVRAQEEGGQPYDVLSWQFVAAANGVTHTIVTLAGAENPVDSETSDGLGSIALAFSSGSMSVSVNGSQIGTVQIQAGIVAFSGSVAFPNGGYTQAAVSIEGVRGDGSSDSFQGGGQWEIGMGYRSAAATQTDHQYLESYWRNGYDNVSVAIAFHSASSDRRYISLSAYGDSSAQDIAFTVIHDSGGWYIEHIEDHRALGVTEIGRWPGIEVEVSGDGLTVRPLGSFTSFLDYVAIDAPTHIATRSIGTINAVMADGTNGNGEISLLVVRTVTRIADGGLFMQGATLDVASQFPSAQMVSLTLRSAVRAGDSITVTGDTTGTIPIDNGRVFLDDEWRPLDGLTLMWCSPDAPPATIGGVTYAPGIYSGGTVLRAGIVYAVASDGTAVEMADAPSGFSVTLDGVWAPAVSMQSGENAASERTELADFTHGEYRWDKDTFIVVMMAVCVLGGVAGSYFRMATILDWAVIGGALSVLWLIL